MHSRREAGGGQERERNSLGIFCRMQLVKTIRLSRASQRNGREEGREGGGWAPKGPQLRDSATLAAIDLEQITASVPLPFEA